MATQTKAILPFDLCGSKELRAGSLTLTDLFASDHKVIGDGVADDTVMFVIWMLSHKVSNPCCCGHELTRGASIV
jgi:hypothetical protein